MKMLGCFLHRICFLWSSCKLIIKWKQIHTSKPDALTEGSIEGFIKGKFYNRYTRIHELLANVIEMKLYDHFLSPMAQDEHDVFQLVMSTVPANYLDPSDKLANPVQDPNYQ